MRTTSAIQMSAVQLSGFARKALEQATAFAGVVGNLIMDVRDCYRPGPYEMRGPRPQLARRVVRSEVLRSQILARSRLRYDA